MELLQKVIFFFSIILLHSAANSLSLPLEEVSPPQTPSYCIDNEISRQPSCVHPPLNCMAVLSEAESPNPLKTLKYSAVQKPFQKKGASISVVAPLLQVQAGFTSSLFLWFRQLRL